LTNPAPTRRSAAPAYLELVRLPNVPTAMADVAMGFLFTHLAFGSRDGWIMGLLIAASSLLYMAGMVLNDVFDAAADAVDRPERPIPSGRVSLRAARWLGWELLVLGVAVGWLAAWLAGDLRPGLVAVGLGACVVGYDAWLKRTPLGPAAMGACRLLNVLLGMSAAAGPWRDEHLLVAAAIGVYIAGVTWFARTEARQSSRPVLVLALAVILGGVLLMGFVPGRTEEVFPLLAARPERWTLLMLVLGAVIGYRCLWAIASPTPYRVQVAVKQCILSLVILDAAACFVVQGMIPAAAILLLLIPTVVLGRWIAST
jgi:4-hydroxybenzoate polyprenyltransferase